MGKTILKHHCVYQVQSETPRHNVYRFKKHMTVTATVVWQRRPTLCGPGNAIFETFAFAQEKTLFGAIGVCSGEIKKKEISRICNHFGVLISHKEIV